MGTDYTVDGCAAFWGAEHSQSILFSNYLDPTLLHTGVRLVAGRTPVYFSHMRWLATRRLL